MHMSFDFIGRRITLAMLVIACGVTSAAAADWPYWRGPTFDEQVKATGLRDDWDPAGGEDSNVLWKREDIGGPCTPIAMNGRIYMTQRSLPSSDREGEKFVCLDAVTGETLWENAYNVWLSDVPAERIGWSSVWMGYSDLSEYTISADARGTRMSDQLPDIGLTAHGYVLDLMGESQQLQIRTWSAQLRMAETIKFPWKEDIWYRMKFHVYIESEPPAAIVVLRGKVWPRDEEEPKEWTITARDESPNLAASPGLYGNAKVAELYLDNVEVTANTQEP